MAYSMFLNAGTISGQLIQNILQIQKVGEVLALWWSYQVSDARGGIDKTGNRATFIRLPNLINPFQMGGAELSFSKDEELKRMNASIYLESAWGDLRGDQTTLQMVDPAGIFFYNDIRWINVGIYGYGTDINGNSSYATFAAGATFNIDAEVEPPMTDLTADGENYKVDKYTPPMIFNMFPTPILENSNLWYDVDQNALTNSKFDAVAHV